MQRAYSYSNIDEAEIRFLIEKNADGIIVVDENGIVLFANPSAEQIFGRSSERLLGFPLGVPLIVGETTEITIHRPAGDQIDAEIRVVETTWDHCPARLASFRDISVRRAMEESLRHSAKMEAIGRLTAGVAHDFNNLLTVVLGNLEAVQRKHFLPDSKASGPILSAKRAAQRGAMLTERLLAFARRKPLEPCVLDLNELVSRMSDLLQRTLGETVNIRTILDEALWKVVADPTELETALLNLAVNARDAMPASGTLMIETRNVELDSAYVSSHAEVAAGSYVLISVADTGTGMTPEILEQVFEPFFTTKAEGRGTGLGLSQVYGFAKQSGGHIQLYSEPGIGTTAKIYLPKATEDDEPIHEFPVDQKRTPEIVTAQSNEFILVVEDDDDVRNFTVGSLRDLGYTVLEAADGRSALQILESEPRICLLFTDLGLPGGMDGKEVAQRARSYRSSLKVLMTTAYAGSVLIHEGRLDAGVHLLPKPFTYADLATRIRELLDSGPSSGWQQSRILVVDDEALVRTLIVDALFDAGMQTEEAASFEEALEKLQRRDDELGAVIIDVGLLDRPGSDLIPLLRVDRPNMPVILATGLLDNDLRQRFASDPWVKFMTKPFELDSLVTELRLLSK